MAMMIPECNVCYETFNLSANRPFVGRCGHSVCEGCVGHLTSSACPVCRKSEGFSRPKPNYALILMIEKRREEEATAGTSDNAEEENKALTTKQEAPSSSVSSSTPAAPVEEDLRRLWNDSPSSSATSEAAPSYSLFASSGNIWGPSTFDFSRIIG